MFNRPDPQRRLLGLIFWLPTFAGVAVLVAALAFLGLRVFGTHDDAAGPLPTPVQPVAPPPPGLPDSSGVPDLFVPSVTGPSPDGAPTTPGRSAGAAGGRPSIQTPPPPRTTRPPAGPVTGVYRVLNTYDDAFIAEVLVSNGGRAALDWTVVARFPDAVGELVTSWVESAPQATLTRSGQTYTWRSGVPVPAGSSVPLRFHFKRSGTGNFPATCTANGSACTIRR